MARDTTLRTEPSVGSDVLVIGVLTVGLVTAAG
jgi:hypothetical protein